MPSPSRFAAFAVGSVPRTGAMSAQKAGDFLVLSAAPSIPGSASVRRAPSGVALPLL